MNKGLAAAGFAAAMSLVSAVSAEPLQYKFAYPASPQGLLNVQGFVPWSEQVTKDSDGTLEVKVFAGGTLANFGNVYDRVINGVIEVGFGIFGPISSDFPKTNVVTLPFETKTGDEAAMALWRLYEKGIVASEFTRVKLLGFSVFPNVSLHSRSKPIKTADDIKGWKISAEGRVLSRSLESLGAAPVTLSATELYQALQRGTIDAAAISFPAILTFKLDEVSKFHLQVPLANDNGFAFMNKDAYAKLPDAAKKAVDRNSGEVYTRKFIQIVKNMTDGARDVVQKQADQVVATLDPAEEARWREKVAPSVEAWVQSTPDGPAVLAAYRDEIKKIRAGNM